MAESKRGDEHRELSGDELVPDKPGSGRLFEKHFVSEEAPVECLGITFADDNARREHFLGILREKLKDLEFRKIEGFPIGSDEDILALSDPPYYTACPNPFLADFINHYGKSYDPNLAYSRKPFAYDIASAKSDPVTMAHTYHTKVPFRALVQYLLHYTSPGDIVLDAFCGSGSLGLACAMARAPDQEMLTEVAKYAATAPSWGCRHALLVDLSPFATFLARCNTSTVAASTFASESRRLIEASERSIGWMYAAESTQGQPGILNYLIWSESYFCDCGAEILYWQQNSPDILPNVLSSEFVCTSCGQCLAKRSAQKATSTEWDPFISRSITQIKYEPVLIDGVSASKPFRRLPTSNDRRLLEKISTLDPEHHVPTQPMLFKDGKWGDKYRSGCHTGLTHTHHFWTRRNLLVLADLFDRARSSPFSLEMLFLCTSFAVKTGTRMHNIGLKGGRINLAGQGYNALQLQGVSAERNLHLLARGKARDLEAVFMLPHANDARCISTSSASSLCGIPDASVDYVFIDPPFGDNISYSELSFLYECWLRVFTNQEPEAIVSPSQGKELATYLEWMTQACRELYRVLKPGRWMTVAFHNSKNSVWNAIQEAIGNAGFVVADVRILDKGQGTYNQMTSRGAVGKDLAISTYKPNAGLVDRFRLEAGTEEGVWDFVRTHLTQLPVFVSRDGRAEAIGERQSYLLFDRMVAFHVQRGVTIPLSAAEFYAGLVQRFSERDGMYFLREQVAEYDKRRLTVKEVLQLELFVTDEASAIQWLKQQLTKKPQTFQELHPQFLREIGGWSKNEQPLELSKLLEQTFLRYDGNGEVPSQIHSYLSTNFKELRNLPKDSPQLRTKGKDRWYVPDPNKAGDLEKLRERALLKEFAEYLPPGHKLAKPESQEGFLPGMEPKPTPIPRGKKMKVIRLEAVRAGFKHCWQNRDYRTIIAVAQRIPENILQEDPKLLMWYDQAITRTGEN